MTNSTLCDRFDQLISHDNNCDCAAHNESLYCCLDKEKPDGFYYKIITFIESELLAAKREGAREMKEKVNIAVRNYKDSSGGWGMSGYEIAFCEELESL